MAQLDLGRATLRIRHSQLQLHIAATAHFKQIQSNSSMGIQDGLSQLPDLEGVWVTEAPEMELRFFLSSNWALKNAVDTLVSGLGNKLCGLKVWSDLGFSARLKSEGDGEIDTSGSYCLKLGLHREHQAHSYKRRWTLPIVMTNPPDVCPPPDVLSAALASISVSLEYFIHDEHMTQAQDLFNFEFDFLQKEFPYLTFESNFETSMQPEILSSMPGYIWPETVRHETSSQSLKSQIPHTPGNRPDPAHDEFFQLLELGMQRLVISNSIKDPKIRVSKDATLKSLPDIAPAVFNTGHREAINQRGVTIPIITKAMSTMLKGSQSPSIEDKLTYFLLPPPSSPWCTSTTSPQTAIVRTAIHSRLWHIAQENTRKSKPVKRKSLMFPTTLSDKNIDLAEDHEYRLLRGQQNFGSLLSATSTASQIQQSEEDEVNFASLLNESDCRSELEDQLLDNCSETSFTNIGESTQTSLDTLFSTAVSSQTAWSNDENMLFSDHRGLAVASYGDGIVTTSYSPGDMEVNDADILMVDGF